MNLILQSIYDVGPALEALARQAQAKKIVRCNNTPYFAWRLEDVQADPVLQGDIQTQAADMGIDACYLQRQLRWQDFGLLAMDMDSTLITIECIDEIADMQGIKPQVAHITEAAMRGEIGFDESLARRVALLRDLDAGALQQVYEERLRLSPGAENLLACARAHGLKTLLVSGGFTFFTERIKAQLGLDFAFSNQLDIVDGKLTGKVVGEIVNAEKKRALLQATCNALGFDSQRAIAMGDGANDLLMMDAAGLSVAFRAKPRVKKQADVALDVVGLDGLLALMSE